MKRAYEVWTPRPDTLRLVRIAEEICDEYSALGYELTLRQLYYQFVARDYLPNTQKSYNSLGVTVSNARLAGMLDWGHLVDRTRNLQGNSHWDSPAQVLRAAAQGYAIDKWDTQEVRVEIWVEKEALAGIVEKVAEQLDVSWFACRGYVSQSEMWSAGQRLGRYIEDGQSVHILHLGDHDPSGIDMTRDIRERLEKFIYLDRAIDRWDLDFQEDSTAEDIADWQDQEKSDCEDSHTGLTVQRIALNRDQIDQYNPPPNPAKLTDSRASQYVMDHGYQSWELDALSPEVLTTLIRDEVHSLLDFSAYRGRVEKEALDRRLLIETADDFARKP